MHYSSLHVKQDCVKKIEICLSDYGLKQERTGQISIFTNCGTLEGIVYTGENETATLIIHGNSDGTVYLLVENLMKRIPQIRQNYQVKKQKEGCHWKKEKQGPVILPSDIAPKIPIGMRPTDILSNEFRFLELYRPETGFSRTKKRSQA